MSHRLAHAALGTFRRVAAALLAATLAVPALAAGRVDVEFVDPDRFADAGLGRAERERTLQALAAHLQRYGARLADGQRLVVRVADVDLAGELRFTPRGELRIANGRVDAPRLSLHWALDGAAGPLRRGDDTLTDLAYLQRLPRQAGELAHEKRLLDDWFEHRVVSTTQEPR
jgi:hypothetical protein